MEKWPVRPFALTLRTKGNLLSGIEEHPQLVIKRVEAIRPNISEEAR